MNLGLSGLGEGESAGGGGGVGHGLVEGDGAGRLGPWRPLLLWRPPGVAATVTRRGILGLLGVAGISSSSILTLKNM